MSMILENFVCGPLDNNTMVLACSKTKRAAVIDPSFGCLKKVLNFSNKNSLILEKVLLTHSHYDHIADVKAIKDKTKASVYIHKLDANSLEFPGTDNVFSLFAVEGVKPDHLLEDNEKITLGDLEILTIHTPGHTPGGVCYFLQDQKILFSGDTLFKGSIGRVDFPTSNPEDMFKSLKKLSKLPKATKVFPGHGNQTTIEKENWLEKAEEIFS